MRRFLLVTCLALSVCLLCGHVAHALTFTLDGLSAGLSGVFPDDLLSAGAGPPPPVPPPLVLPGAGGLPIGPPPPPPPPVDVDAFSFTLAFPGGFSVVGAQFSVAPGSVGAAGTALFGESSTGDQPADIYASALGGGNGLLWDGDGIPAPGLPLFGPVGVFEPPSAPPGAGISNVNGWDGSPFIFGPPASPGIVYSVTAVDAATHPVYFGSGATGAWLMFSPPVAGYSVFPALYATDIALGLGPGDDIDAVQIIDGGPIGPPGDTIYFSLTPGSPTLGALGASPADILVTTIGGAPAVAFPAASMGLLFSDDMDALSLEVVPEPCALALLLLGSLGLASRRRR